MKRNSFFPVAALLLSCLLCSFTFSAFAFELQNLDDEPGRWKRFAGIPEHQEIEGDSLYAIDSERAGNLCPK
jgi:hypothetical protein